MSYSFHMRFDSADVTVSQLLAACDGELSKLSLSFSGRIDSLVPGKNGHPIADLDNVQWVNDEPQSRDGIETDSLRAASSRVAKQWGVSFMCINAYLAQELGRSTAMETDVQVFQTKSGSTLRYVESSTAYAYRQKDADAAQNLYALQLGLARMGGFQCGVYDEEDYDAPAVVTLREIEERLARHRSDPVPTSIVVAKELCSFERAKTLAGKHAGLVRIGTGGLILFPFLLP